MSKQKNTPESVSKKLTATLLKKTLANPAAMATLATVYGGLVKPRFNPKNVEDTVLTIVRYVVDAGEHYDTNWEIAPDKEKAFGVILSTGPKSSCPHCGSELVALKCPIPSGHTHQCPKDGSLHAPHGLDGNPEPGLISLDFHATPKGKALMAVLDELEQMSTPVTDAEVEAVLNKHGWYHDE